MEGKISRALALATACIRLWMPILSIMLRVSWSKRATGGSSSTKMRMKPSGSARVSSRCNPTFSRSIKRRRETHCASGRAGGDSEAHMDSNPNASGTSPSLRDQSCLLRWDPH
jgi:hypothetical protein